MIISASRRTDIPAFYSEWFMNRLKAGYLLTRNPFNKNQVKRVSLLSSDIEAIVFWTRNADKLVPKLSELDSMGYAYYFQYTITGYPRPLEKSVPNPLSAIETFKKLSDFLGPNRVLWRYDPILVSSLTDIDEHKRLFEKIAGLLHGRTKRVTISFADFYKKTERNLKAVEGLEFTDITTVPLALWNLAQFMADVASAHEFEIQTCSERIDLSNCGITHGKCIDDRLLKDEFGIYASGQKDNNQREECGCVKSVDIGDYNTCLHGCSYCYATHNRELAAKNSSHHDSESPFLIGPAPENGVDAEKSQPFAEKQPLLF